MCGCHPSIAPIRVLGRCIKKIPQFRRTGVLQGLARLLCIVSYLVDGVSPSHLAAPRSQHFVIAIIVPPALLRPPISPLGGALPPEEGGARRDPETCWGGILTIPHQLAGGSPSHQLYSLLFSQSSPSNLFAV